MAQVSSSMLVNNSKANENNNQKDGTDKFKITAPLFCHDLTALSYEQV
jgi:hypothetical protein